MLTELLEERSKRALITKSVDLVKKVEIKANQVDKHFYDKYRLNESDESANQFGISSFERIGWADPFPNDNAILTIEKDLS